MCLIVRVCRKSMMYCTIRSRFMWWVSRLACRVYTVLRRVVLSLGRSSNTHRACCLVLVMSIGGSRDRCAASSRVIRVVVETLLSDGGIMARVLLHVGVGTCGIGQASWIVRANVVRRGRRRRLLWRWVRVRRW